jgi:hypothetical protein
MVGAFCLALLFGSPWIVGIVLLLRRLPREDAAFPSMGEQLRRRMGIS